MNKVKDIRTFIRNWEQTRVPYCVFTHNSEILLVEGRLVENELLSEISREKTLFGYSSISMVPFSQLRERGFETNSNGEKILSLIPERITKCNIQDFITLVADIKIQLPIDDESNNNDDEYKTIIENIVENEIKQGEGSNFLLSRKFRSKIPFLNLKLIQSIIKQLIVNEFGSYLTFCFYDGTRYFIGASPERHLSIYDGEITMNPICGTLPKKRLNSSQSLFDFITDQKEINELFQVVDETLKMMARVCSDGGRLTGPFLKEMGKVIHTEYILEGKATEDYIDIFRDTMFAPTMVGSPLENAARIIKKYESDSRSYYSSAILFIGTDERESEFLDSAITIRTMQLEEDGNFVIQAGASIVRDSTPEGEYQEVLAKSQGLLDSMTTIMKSYPMLDKYMNSDIEKTLITRNTNLSQFWINKQEIISEYAGKKILIIDNKDEFSMMLLHMFKYLGFEVRLVKILDKDYSLDDFDLVLLGPGPGNPTNMDDPRIEKTNEIASKLIKENRKFMAICLGHQVLCNTFGLRIVRMDPPLQGIQREIDLFGNKELVGFYNTFFAINEKSIPGVIIASDEQDFILALRSENFCSFQFHLESILTYNGIQILKDCLKYLKI